MSNESPFEPPKSPVSPIYGRPLIALDPDKKLTEGDVTSVI